MTVQILVGDCRELLRTLPDKSVNCVVTSQPYWGLRDYKIPPSIWGGDPACRHRFATKRTKIDLRRGAGLKVLGARMKGGGLKATQMAADEHVVERGFCKRCGAWRGCFGLEPDYKLYVEHTVEIFREVRRVLRDDGTLWLNMGDCYATYRAGWTADRYKTEGWDHAFRDKPFNTVGAGGGHNKRGVGSKHDFKGSNRAQRGDGNDGLAFGPRDQPNRKPQSGLKYKDLVMMPARIAIALQEDGWYLRSDIIWQKKNPMPESVYDRPTTAHEHIFLLAKSANTLCWRHDETGEWTWTKPEPQWRWRNRDTRKISATPQGKGWFKFNLWSGFDYYYDFAAIMEPSSPDSRARAARGRAPDHKHSNGADLSGKAHGIAVGAPVAGRYPSPAAWSDAEGHHGSVHPDGRRWRKASEHNGDWQSDGPRPKNNANFDLHLGSAELVPMRNKRSVWSIATKPFKGAHFATFPPDLVLPCILAGCPAGGTVLDPFGGAGTTGLVAEQNGRNTILIEINPGYAKMAEARIARLRMGAEEKKRANIKSSGKLKPVKGLPLFTEPKRKSKRVPASPGSAAA